MEKIFFYSNLGSNNKPPRTMKIKEIITLLNALDDLENQDTFEITISIRKKSTAKKPKVEKVSEKKREELLAMTPQDFFSEERFFLAGVNPHILRAKIFNTILKNIRPRTMGEFVAYTKDELLLMRGVKNKVMGCIEIILAKNGLSLSSVPQEKVPKQEERRDANPLLTLLEQ